MTNYVCIIVWVSFCNKNLVKFKLFFYFVANKIKEYISLNLRAPPEADILKWAVKLKVAKKDAVRLSNEIPYRQQLGKQKKSTYVFVDQTVYL